MAPTPPDAPLLHAESVVRAQPAPAPGGKPRRPRARYRWVTWALMVAALACALRLRWYLANDPGWVGHAPFVTGLIVAIAVLSAAALLSIPLAWGPAHPASGGREAEGSSPPRRLAPAMAWPRWVLLVAALLTGPAALYLHHYQLTLSALEGTTGLVVVLFAVFAAGTLAAWSRGGGNCGPGCRCGHAGAATGGSALAGCACGCVHCGAGACQCGHGCCTHGGDDGGCDCAHCAGCAGSDCCGECPCYRKGGDADHGDL